MQRCSGLMQSGEERCREMQRCSIGVEMWRCRGVERCSGSAEVNHSHRCRGSRAGKAKIWRRCWIEFMNIWHVQRFRCAEV